MKMKAKTKTGFTLIELLVVIAIIGILAGVVMVSMNGARKSGRVARTAADLRQIVNILNLYYNDNGLYPCFDHNWNAAVETGWAAPYAVWPKPLWGPSYVWEHGSVDDFYYSISFYGIPDDEALMLYEKIDDGDLATGQLQYTTNYPEADRLEYGFMDQNVRDNNPHCWA